MSDLTNSCEYFNADKMCDSVAENAKAQEKRQVKCENAEKASCCYICPLRSECVISCNYLGSPDVTYTPVGPQKAPIESTIDEPQEPQQTQTTNNQATYCMVCNVEMSESKTELRVDKWKGQKPIMPSADMLPIVVYLCPQCGKIEFKADRQQSKE